MPGARDGQFRIHRGEDTPPWCLLLYDDTAGRWRCTPYMEFVPEEDDSVRLIGPYIVDYTDIPHDGDTMALWTPQVGDVLLRLFPNMDTAIPWDHGQLYIGQMVDGTVYPPHSTISGTDTSGSALISFVGLDSVLAINVGLAFDASGSSRLLPFGVFSSTDPVQIQLAQVGEGADPTQGHVELYALVATPTAP